MEPTLSSSLAKFAFTFCNELNEGKTTVCSPLSAEMVLAMTALGCEGRSRAELMQALDIPDDEALCSSFALLTSTLQSIKGVTVTMANKVFVEKGAKIKPVIQKHVKKVFKSGLKQIDFEERDEASRIMNNWVAKKSKGLIKDVISAENLNEDTRLVLISAIYFKGDWKIKFPTIFTKNRTFHVSKSTAIEVPMMYRDNVYFKYGIVSKLKATLLQMEYEGNEASMVVVLPDDIEGLSGVLQRLAGGYDLMADVGALTTSEIDVMIPKFKVEMTISLKELLCKLGIQSVFDENCSEIYMLTSHERQVVSEAVQKVCFAVDESGTEAAAVTAVNCRRACCYRFKPRFVADRPFLYLLVVRGIPLFVGVYEGREFAAQIN